MRLRYSNQTGVHPSGYSWSSEPLTFLTIPLWSRSSLQALSELFSEFDRRQFQSSPCHQLSYFSISVPIAVCLQKCILMIWWHAQNFSSPLSVALFHASPICRVTSFETGEMLKWGVRNMHHLGSSLCVYVCVRCKCDGYIAFQQCLAQYHQQHPLRSKHTAH